MFAGQAFQIWLIIKYVQVFMFLSRWMHLFPTYSSTILKIKMYLNTINLLCSSPFMCPIHNCRKVFSYCGQLSNLFHTVCAYLKPWQVPLPHPQMLLLTYSLPRLQIRPHTRILYLHFFPRSLSLFLCWREVTCVASSQRLAQAWLASLESTLPIR